MLGQDPPGVHLELAHGEIVVSPSPSPDHSEIILNLVQILGAHVRQHKLGKLYSDTDTIFDSFNTRRPDILFFSRARLDLVGKKAARWVLPGFMRGGSFASSNIRHGSRGQIRSL